MLSYKDIGYNDFLQRQGLQQTRRLSSLQAKNSLPLSSVGAGNVALPLNATTDIVFSPVDFDTAAWTQGTIYFADGTDSGLIDADNTGNIAATTYVYWDRENLGVLMTTTDVDRARGANKLLVAIIEMGASGKDCKITPIIAAGLTVTNLTAANIQGDQLDVLAAKTGTLQVDETVQVGGSVGGVVSVLDGSEVEKVRLDEDGVLVNSGKITIKNDSESVSFDAKGLLSLQNFGYGETVYEDDWSASIQTINHTANLPTFSYVDLTNSSITFSLDRDRYVYMVARITTLIETNNINGGAISYWAIDVNGSAVERAIGFADYQFLTGSGTDSYDNGNPLDDDTWYYYYYWENSDRWGYADTVLNVHLHYFAQLAAGSNTIKLKAGIDTLGFNYQLEIWGYRFTYFILGT